MPAKLVSLKIFLRIETFWTVYTFKWLLFLEEQEIELERLKRH